MRLSIAAAALLAAGLCQADDRFYIGAALGSGEIDLVGDISGTGEFDTVGGDDDALVGELLFGLQTSTGWLLEGSYEGYDNISLLLVDSVDYDAFRVGFGYAPQPRGRFGFVAKAGLAFWDIELRESPLFNPGDESVFETDGEDLFFQVGGEFHALPSLRLGLAYDYTDTDFGDVSAIKFNVRWLFSN